MKTYTEKSNAKRAARKLVDAYSGIELAEPVAAPDGGWHAAVKATGIHDGGALAEQAIILGGRNDPAKAVIEPDEGQKFPAESPLIDDAAIDAALTVLKPGSKAAQVFAMLRRSSGASAREVGEAMGWKDHTTRAFISVHARTVGLALDTMKGTDGKTVYRIAGVV